MAILQKQLHNEQITTSLSGILFDFKKNAGLITWTYKLLTNNDNTMCFILLANDEEISKFWSKFDEPIHIFLTRIDSDVKSIMSIK